MASTSETRVYSALFSTTLDDHRSELADQIHAGIPLLWYMMNMGRGRDRGAGRGVRYQNGGAKIKVPVVWAQNANVKSYSKFEPLTVNATDEITVAIDSMKQVATTVGISGEELDQNQGMAAKRDLLRDKLDIAELGMKENIEQQLMQGTFVAGSPTDEGFIPGNNGKDLNPLGFLIQKNQVASGGTRNTVHDINSQTGVEDWWQNQATFSTTTAAAGQYAVFKKEMANLYNNCSKGSSNDAPDLIICDQRYFEAYEMGLTDQQRYGNYGSEAAASVGFTTMKFRGATMFWSEFMPGLGSDVNDAVTLTPPDTDVAAFFINTRWLELVVSSNVNFVATEFQEPYDQDAIWAKILWRAQLMTKQRRKLGCHVGVNSGLLP